MPLRGICCFTISTDSLQAENSCQVNICARFSRVRNWPSSSSTISSTSGPTTEHPMAKQVQLCIWWRQWWTYNSTQRVHPVLTPLYIEQYTLRTLTTHKDQSWEAFAQWTSRNCTALRSKHTATNTTYLHCRQPSATSTSSMSSAAQKPSGESLHYSVPETNTSRHYYATLTYPDLLDRQCTHKVIFPANSIGNLIMS